MAQSQKLLSLAKYLGSILSTHTQQCTTVLLYVHGKENTCRYIHIHKVLSFFLKRKVLKAEKMDQWLRVQATFPED